MRYKFKDVLKRPSRFSAWWYDTPYKRPRNWWTLLFMPGRGWLRLKAGTFKEQEIIDPEIGGPWYEYDCFPPLRRFAIPIVEALKWVFRAGGWYEWQGKWYRYTFDEWWTPWSEINEYLKDPNWPDDYMVY